MDRMLDRAKIHGISLSQVTAASPDSTHGDTEDGRVDSKKHMLSTPRPSMRRRRPRSEANQRTKIARRV